MTLSIWTLATLKAPLITVCSPLVPALVPAQDNILLIQMMWRGGAILGCESHICHSFSPCTCWHRQRKTTQLQKRVVRIHLTPCGHGVVTHLLLPSSIPGQRCGSWHQGHLCRRETLGMACSYNISNTSSAVTHSNTIKFCGVPMGKKRLYPHFFVMSLFGKEFFYTKPPVIWAIILFFKKPKF